MDREINAVRGHRVEANGANSAVVEARLYCDMRGRAEA